MTTSQAAMSDPDVQRRRDLREFLMSRRARVSPVEAGLPDGGARRRTPGLRREEVAVLAGVGVSWYQWLEQGRDITVSPQVLDSVSRVLKLGETERRHLYVLAGLNPPLPTLRAAPVTDGLRRLIDAWMPFPAHILDPYWNVITFNEAAGLVFGYADHHVNCLVNCFTNPIYSERDTTWRVNAEHVVAQFRVAASGRPGDPLFQAIVDELAEVSPEFAEIWARNDVKAGGMLYKQIAHPVAGLLNFESTQLRVPERPDLTIVLHNPELDTDTAAKLEWLVTPEGRRGMMRPAG
ncbi:helix-turn-helix transcriptional regulator [Kitasatospora cystarginea]